MPRSRIHLSICAGLAVAAVLGALVVSSGAAPYSQDRKEVDILEEMMGIRSALRDLSRQLQDASKDEDSIKLIWNMQGHLMTARTADPPTLELLPADQHPGHRTAYRKAMAEVLGELAELEIDVLDGRRDDAMKRIRGSLFQLREAAHDRFQRED